MDCPLRKSEAKYKDGDFQNQECVTNCAWYSKEKGKCAILLLAEKDFTIRGSLAR